MTDPRELVDAHESELLFGGGGGSTIPAIEALRAVLDEHEWVHIGGTYGKWCKTCTTGPADSPHPAAWPCPTIRAITDALEAK